MSSGKLKAYVGQFQNFTAFQEHQIMVSDIGNTSNTGNTGNSGTISNTGNTPLRMFAA